MHKEIENKSNTKKFKKWKTIIRTSIKYPIYHLCTKVKDANQRMDTWGTTFEVFKHRTYKSSAPKQVKGRINKSNGIELLLFSHKKSTTKRNVSHILIIHQEPKPTVQRLK